MTLRDLLKGIDILAANTDLDAEVNCPRYDSRAVTPNDVFVAIPGFELDGLVYSGRDGKGCRACVVQSGAPEECTFWSDLQGPPWL